jgi:uncharacterized protein (DUF433 family)
VGTRVPPETFVEGMAAGMSLEELHEDFPTVSLEQIKCILGFAQRKQFAALKFCINEQVPIRSRPLIDQSRVH